MKFVETLKVNYFILISTFLFIYIIFNLLDGERGLFSYFEKKEKQKQLILKRDNLNSTLNTIEKKISLLSENIDKDYLEILYREKFFYGKQNEEVFLRQKKNDN